MAGQTSAEVKAQVMAALLAGQSVSKVAEQYKLNKGTVSRWRSKARRALNGDADHSNGNGDNAKKEIGELVIEYLREGLTTLRAQLEVLRDPEYVRSQDAASIATLHGVLADKQIRLLEALAPDDENGAA